MRKKTVFFLNEFREINYFLREDLPEGKERVGRYAHDIWVRFFEPWLPSLARRVGTWIERRLDAILALLAWGLSIEVVILAWRHINFARLFR